MNIAAAPVHESYLGRSTLYRLHNGTTDWERFKKEKSSIVESFQNSEGETEDCAICYDVLDSAQKPHIVGTTEDPADDHKVIFNQKCTHAFHVGCLGHWLTTGSSCPMCKRALIDSEEEVRGIANVRNLLARIADEQFDTTVGLIKSPISIHAGRLIVCILIAAYDIAYGNGRVSEPPPTDEQRYVDGGAGVKYHPDGRTMVEGLIMAVAKNGPYQRYIEALEYQLPRRAATCLSQSQNHADVEITESMRWFAREIAMLAVRMYAFNAGFFA